MERFTLESIAKLQDAIDKNKLVIFTGAGVSANSGLPSWGEIINAYAKGIGNSPPPYTTDDYLKIPQYYFNERGSKEYYDVLTNLFNEKAKPNPIHEILFELNPAHIITTNFDDLLEQTVLEKGIFFDTVKMDKDLPYTPNNKMIIKMHGDLLVKNVVLKEDDYLSYSNNFKLIENFVKSLFATYTVLFVGYSVSDPDVRLIFQWVKDILKDDFQHAYLLNVGEKSKDINHVEFQYYKNRGINILYFSTIEKFVSGMSDHKKLHGRGLSLYKFLKYIKTAKNDIGKSAIDIIYNKLSILNALNKVLPNDIKYLLEESAIFHVDYSTLETDSAILKSYVTEAKKLKPNNIAHKEQLEKKQEVDKIFLKADITQLIFWSSTAHSKKVSYKFITEQPLKYEDSDLLSFFQYKKIKKDLLSSVIEYDYPNMTLIRKAFYFYKLGDFLSSYKILKIVSIKAFKSNDYLTFFLSEFNRRHVGKLANTLWLSDIKMSKEELEIISEEVATIDLDQIYMKMPQNQRQKYFFLKDLLNFKLIYQNFYESVKSQNEVKEEENIQRVAPRETGPIFKLNFRVAQLWEYINLNYLMIDHYSELKSFYKSYIESVLISYTTIDRNKDESEVFFPFINVKVNKMEAIPFFALYIMVTNIEAKYLEKLLDKYNINQIVLKSPDDQELLLSYQNLIDSFLEIDKFRIFIDKINCLTLILSRVPLKSEEFVAVINGLRLLLPKSHLLNGKYVRQFIYHQVKHNKEHVETDSLTNYLEDYLAKLISLKVIDDYYESTRMIEILVYGINSANSDFKMTSPILLTFINTIKKDLNISSYMECVVPIYTIAPHEVAIRITELTQFALENNFSLDLYAEACVRKVIGPSAELEGKCIAMAESIVRENESKQGKSFPDPVYNVMAHLTNIIYSNSYIDKNKYRKFIGKEAIFDFFIDPDKFNYDNFDFNWLIKLSEEWKQKIMKNKKAKSILKAKLKDAILSNNTDIKLKEIYFKYFC